MRRLRSPLLWVCAALLGNGLFLEAQSGARIAGLVSDAGGVPLPGVTVEATGTTTLVTVTGGDGRFEFPALREGRYDVRAQLPGFAPVRKSVQVAAGETRDLSFTLLVQFLEQTVVTAARAGEQDVQRIPMAVSVVSGRELQRVEARTVEQVAGRAPGVTFSQNTGFTQLTIRGIGTNVVFTGGDPSSAVYVDGVYLARPAMGITDVVDLDRVEVLRGPQGTLYGRNAVGGALRVITRAPANELEASARLVAGNYGALRAEARVAGPIVRDRVLGSVTLVRGVRDGPVRDLDHPDRPLGGEDVTAVAARLQWVVTPRSDLLLWTDFTHQDPVLLTYAKVLAVKPGFVVDNPRDLHEVRTSTPGDSRNLHYGVAARYRVRLAGDTTLTSLTAVRRLDYRLVVDSDITELPLAAARIHEKHHQVSEELTVRQQRGDLAWLGGVFLFADVDRQPTTVELGGPRIVNSLNPTADTGVAAAFGQATVPLTKRLSATAGLRYTTERKTFSNEGQLTPLEGPSVPIPGSVFAYSETMTHSAWSPKIGLEVRAGESVFGYVSATKGFKSGGFNASSTQPGRGYHPETAWTSEAGIKVGIPDGRARLNTAVFLTDYRDLQVQTAIIPGVIEITNAAEATIRGVEVEGTTRFGRGVYGGGHLAWLDATYDRYIAVGVDGVTGDVAGRRLTNAPEWSGRAWLEWNSSGARGWTSSIRADSRWQSTVYYTPFNDAIQRQRAYGLLDVSAELRLRRWGLTIGAYVRNLTNEDYITGAYSSPPPAYGGRPGDPRLTGVQLTIGRP